MSLKYNNIIIGYFCTIFDHTGKIHCIRTIVIRLVFTKIIGVICRHISNWEEKFVQMNDLQTGAIQPLLQYFCYCSLSTTTTACYAKYNLAVLLSQKQITYCIRSILHTSYIAHHRDGHLSKSFASIFRRFPNSQAMVSTAVWLRTTTLTPAACHYSLRALSHNTLTRPLPRTGTCPTRGQTQRPSETRSLRKCRPCRGRTRRRPTQRSPIPQSSRPPIPGSEPRPTRSHSAGYGPLRPARRRTASTRTTRCRAPS